jgi:hypothetical protein
MRTRSVARAESDASSRLPASVSAYAPRNARDALAPERRQRERVRKSRRFLVVRDTNAQRSSTSTARAPPCDVDHGRELRAIDLGVARDRTTTPASRRVPSCTRTIAPRSIARPCGIQ